MDDLLCKHNLNREKVDSKIFLTILLKSKNTLYFNESNPGENSHGGEKSSWRRLADYILESRDEIVGMELRMNNMVTTLKENHGAYFFIYKIFAVIGLPPVRMFGLGSSPNRSAEAVNITFVGEDGASYREQRNKEKCGFGLIVNPEN